MKLLLPISLLLIGLFLNVLAIAGNPAKQTLRATRIAVAPKIDGVLDEPAWHHEHAQTVQFTTMTPVAGKVLPQKTFVSIIYDDYAIYVGAKMFDDPKNLRHELGLRDDFDRNTDWFSILIDTYDKQQSAFGFGVTAAGAQGDVLISADNWDPSWNAVWKSDVKLGDDGWVAEFEIPYAALRFPKQDIQLWGINFGRYLRNTQEESYWNYINPNINGTVTQFGHLEGIESVKPPLRLQLFPFVSGYLNKNHGEAITPAVSYGADLKWGLNEAYTLDMSLVPDFRQTISDQKVLNLGPYEVQFQENRQFFTEGMELFGRGGIFYSRRIGESQWLTTEPRTATEEITRNAPETAPIYNITKVSGRNKNGTGIGLLNAITGPTSYSVKDSIYGTERTLRADPLTNYNIFVVDQNMKHNSNWSFVTTNVNRDQRMGGENVTLARMAWFDKTNTWNPRVLVSMSNSFAPDASGKIVNTPGYRYVTEFNKVSGNFQFFFSRYAESKTYTHNALGYLQAPNELTHNLTLMYNRNKAFAKGLFNNGSISFSPYHTQLHEPRRYSDAGYSLNANAQFRNFWGVWVEQWIGFGQDDFFEPRWDGYYFSTPASGSVGAGFSSDSRKKLYIEYNVGAWKRPSWHQWDHWMGGTLRYRINNKLWVSQNTRWNYRRREIGFAGQLFDTQTGELEHIIMGQRYVNTVTNTFTSQWTFSPYMALNLRVRHYWSYVDVVGTFNLDSTGVISPINLKERFSNEGKESPDVYYDRNYNVFNIDLQYSWQFAPGSFMNIVWKKNVETYGLDTGDTYGENLNYLLQQGGNNSLSLRIIYFLDYQTVARRFS